MRSETPEVISLLMAEDAGATEVTVQSSLGETIVREENSKYSGTGFADYAHGPYVEREDPGDVDWHDAFLSAIQSQKSVLTDAEREKFEERHAEIFDKNLAETVKKNAEAQAQEDAEAEAAAQEAEQALDNPLDQFAEDSVQDWMQYLGLTPEDLQNPTVARMLASQMSSAVEADQAEANRAAQQGSQPGQQYTATPEEYQAYAQELHRVASDPSVNDPYMASQFAAALGQYLGADSEEARKNCEGLGHLLTVSYLVY